MLISESTSDRIVDIARKASTLLLEYFNTQMRVSYKDDNSPVTEADIAANTMLVDALRNITPEIPIISEESSNHGAVGELFWLIDPLDGTRAFVKNIPEFSINIGLVHQRRAVYGVLAVPPDGSIYVGGEGIAPYKLDKNNNKTMIQTRRPPSEGLAVVKSATSPSEQMQTYLDTLNIAHVRGCSSALKFGLIAEGLADLYPRLGRTMEWDTAAGHAIVTAAGGRMTTMNGSEFFYNKPNFENGGFVVHGSATKTA